MYLFFDTETTGTPKNYKASHKDLENWPRITQLAWQSYDVNGNLTGSSAVLIKPNGWTVPTEKFFIDNNMSTERCEREGVPILIALTVLQKSLNETQYLIAHNMQFDLMIVASEMYRIGMTAKQVHKICTMQASTDICRLPGPYGYKWPKLEELHQHLFGCKFEGAHDAGDDVSATAKCFFELKKRKLI